jgi:hypothetical protein
MHQRDQSVNVVHEKPKLTVRISRNTRIHYIYIILTSLKALQTGVRNQVGKEVISPPKRPARLWNLPGLLFNWQWGHFTAGRRTGAWCHLHLMLRLRLCAFMTYITASLHLSGQNLKSVVENMAVDTVTSTPLMGIWCPQTQAQLSKLIIRVVISSMRVSGKVSEVAALLTQVVRSSYSGRTVGAFVSPGEMPVQYRQTARCPPLPNYYLFNVPDQYDSTHKLWKLTRRH